MHLFSTEERVPSTVAPSQAMQNISPLDLEKMLQSANGPFNPTTAINKQDRYVKKLRELRREFSKEQNQILCYCLKPALKHFNKSGEMFWTCQKWKSEGDCCFTRYDMPLDQLSDDEQIDDEIPLTQVWEKFNANVVCVIQTGLEYQLLKKSRRGHSLNNKNNVTNNTNAANTNNNEVMGSWSTVLASEADPTAG